MVLSNGRLISLSPSSLVRPFAREVSWGFSSGTIFNMQFVTVSDVHIKEAGDSAEVLFLKFLNHPKTKASQTIFLLGDIFDLIVGGHEEYVEKFPQTFESIKSLLKNGKKIYQFEGNHDFHFKKLIEKLKTQWDVSHESWIYRTEPIELEFSNKKFLFAHGDEIEIENPSYQRYRKLIRSGLINFLANNIVPFEVVNAIGVSASKKSRQRNEKRYSTAASDEKVRNKFRRVWAIERDKRKLDYLICGHSHCLDLFEEKGTYANNGYFPSTKSFFFFDGESISIESL